MPVRGGKKKDKSYVGAKTTFALTKNKQEIDSVMHEFTLKTDDNDSLQISSLSTSLSTLTLASLSRPLVTLIIIYY